MLQYLHDLCDPALDSLQQIYIFLALGNQELDLILHILLFMYCITWRINQGLNKKKKEKVEKKNNLKP